MKKKIIDGKEVARECRNCFYSNSIGDDEQILCKKHGIRNLDSNCRRFKYDPLCRVPKKSPKIAELSAEDFEL